MTSDSSSNPVSYYSRFLRIFTCSIHNMYAMRTGPPYLLCVTTVLRTKGKFGETSNRRSKSPPRNNDQVWVVGE